MSKTVLIIIGVILVVMGVSALINLFPALGWEVSWHAVIKIVIGLAAIGVAVTDKS
jgi:hypothetical protein